MILKLSLLAQSHVLPSICIANIHGLPSACSPVMLAKGASPVELVSPAAFLPTSLRSGTPLSLADALTCLEHQGHPSTPHTDMLASAPLIRSLLLRALLS